MYAKIANNTPDCVKMIKAERVKCFKHKYNVKFMENFHKYLCNLRLIFPS